jgi:plasmid stability protein
LEWTDDQVYERLKARAVGNNRSLEAELREILVAASKQLSMAEARARAAEIRQNACRAEPTPTRPS